MAELGLTITATGAERHCSLPVGPWHFEQSEAEGVVTLILEPGTRANGGIGMFVTDDGLEEGVRTWGAVPAVGGETEAQVVNVGGVVYILG